MGRRTTRRDFIKKAGTGIAAFHIVPRYVLGGPGHTPPSEMITRAVIGTGSQGMHHVTSYPKTLAVCDVDKQRLDRALKKAGDRCRGYTDFRRVLERKDIDTVHIPTPPHWHALISIAAAKAGKDIYCEKPLTRFIREGRVLSEVVRQYGAVLQVNTWGTRGHQRHREMRKLVANGLLGTPVTVVLNPRYCGSGFKITASRNMGVGPLPGVPVPAHLDYDLWLGPAPHRPYNPRHVHSSFRGYWDFAGGGLLDMGMHHLDPVLYALGKTNVGPVEVSAVAKWPPDPMGAREWQTINVKYADGTTIIMESWQWGKKTTEGMAYLEGPKGKYYGPGKTDPPQLIHEIGKYPDPPKLHGWEHAVRTRDDSSGTHPNAEQGHRCVTVLHLANIAIRTGRTIRWDPQAERVLGDEEANRFVDVPMRAPWHL